LAGIGIDSLSDFIARLRKSHRIRFILREGFILLCLGIFIIGMILFTQSATRQLLISGLTGKDFHIANMIWQCGLVTVVTGIFILWLHYPMLTIKKLKVLLVGILIIDLFWFGEILKQDLNKAINPQQCLQEPAVVKVIKRDRSVYRVYSLSNQLYEGYADIYDSIGLLTRLSGLYYGIQTFHLYGPSHILRYYELLGDIEAPWKVMSGQDRAEKLYQKLNILSTANIKYIITKIPLHNAALELVYSGEVKVYRFKGSLPRAFFVPQGISLQHKQDILGYLNRPEFNPTQTVVLEKFPFTQFPQENKLQKIDADVQLIKEDLHRILIQTVSSDSGFLFLSKYYYPGWFAYIDGKQTPIYQANYLFSAILLPAGTHTVSFIFRPKSFYWGFTITAFTILFLFIYLIVSMRKKSR
jgi:hypothetical protein